MNGKTMELQEPKIDENTPVKWVKPPLGVMKAKRRFKKPKYKSSVTEYDENFNLVSVSVLRFEERK